MASGQDLQKRQAWEQRLERFRTSGLSVTRFCEQDRVSVHTFYYWARRIRSTPARTAVSVPGTGSRRGRMLAGPSTTTGVSANAAIVRFSWNAGVEASVPADCLEAVRCLAECLASGARNKAFQEMIVKA